MSKEENISPHEVFYLDEHPTCFLVCDSSLFIGTTNGDILEWNGRIIRKLRRKASFVQSLAKHNNTLWVAATEHVEIWNLVSEEIITAYWLTDFVGCMVLWKERIIMGIEFGVEVGMWSLD